MIDNISASMIKLPDQQFIETRQYRRFAEFCQATKHSNYIGLCYGPPGVGKTISARHYSNWDFQETYLEHGMKRFLAPAEVRDYDTVFFTPPVVHTARDLVNRLTNLRKWLSIFVVHTYAPEELTQLNTNVDPTKLIIVDEADRLSTQGLEYFRSVYDEDEISVVFMGMPGVEKRLARYPQLYSRIGFVHEFKTLSHDEMSLVIESKWKELLTDDEVVIEDEAQSALIRITQGNFRLLLRLLMQVERLMRINELTTVTKGLVEAARDVLIIGIS